MTLYKGSIHKEITSGYFLGEKWTNVYTIEETNALEAMGVLLSVALIEADNYVNYVTITKCGVVDPNATDDKRTNVVDYAGAVDPTGLGAMLPLFNTVRVVFGDEVQRPESKYLRGVLMSEFIEVGRISGEKLTAIAADYTTPLEAYPQLVGPAGEPFTTIVAQKTVQMRQLGWGRRTRPGFKRGWVPV